MRKCKTKATREPLTVESVSAILGDKVKHPNPQIGEPKEGCIIKKSYRNQFAEKRQIVKYNALLNGISELSLLEYQLINLAISQLQEEQNDDIQDYHFLTSSVLNVLELPHSENQYRLIKRTINKLQEKTIFLKNGEGEVEQHLWFSRTFYADKQGYFILTLNPILRPYLLNLHKNFTQYPLIYVFRLDSYYTVRLYELLKEYRGLYKRNFGLAELRLLLGIPKNSFLSYSQLKNRVLLPAIKAINIHTDIACSFIEHRNGRTVNLLSFKIAKKDNYQLLHQPKTRFLSEETLGYLISLGVSPKEIYYLSENYTEKDIAEQTGVLIKREIENPIIRKSKFIKRAIEKKKHAPLKQTSVHVTVPITEVTTEQVPMHYFSEKLVNFLVNQGVPMEQVDFLRRHYTAKRVVDNLEYTLHRYSKGNMRNYTAFLIKAVEENYCETAWSRIPAILDESYYTIPLGVVSPSVPIASFIKAESTVSVETANMFKVSTSQENTPTWETHIAEAWSTEVVTDNTPVQAEEVNEVMFINESNVQNGTQEEVDLDNVKVFTDEEERALKEELNLFYSDSTVQIELERRKYQKLNLPIPFKYLYSNEITLPEKKEDYVPPSDEGLDIEHPVLSEVMLRYRSQLTKSRAYRDVVKVFETFRESMIVLCEEGMTYEDIAKHDEELANYFIELFPKSKVTK